MRRPIFLAVLLLLLAAAGTAQKLESLPGYVPIQALGLFPEDRQAEVEINLDGPLLNMVAAATRGDDPQFSSVMAGLKSIQVRAFPLKGVDLAGLKVRIGHAIHWLEERGWKATLRVRDKDQETYIYLKESAGRIEGLTLLSLDPADEAVVINIVGRIDPAQLGRISQSLHVKVPQLQKDSPQSGNPKKPQ